MNMIKIEFIYSFYFRNKHVNSYHMIDRQSLFDYSKIFSLPRVLFCARVLLISISSSWIAFNILKPHYYLDYFIKGKGKSLNIILKFFHWRNEVSIEWKERIWTWFFWYVLSTNITSFDIKYLFDNTRSEIINISLQKTNYQISQILKLKSKNMGFLEPAPTKKYTYVALKIWSVLLVTFTIYLKMVSNVYQSTISLLYLDS